MKLKLRRRPAGGAGGLKAEIVCVFQIRVRIRSLIGHLVLLSESQGQTRSMSHSRDDQMLVRVTETRMRSNPKKLCKNLYSFDPNDASGWVDTQAHHDH